jgi:hypothetical protein
LDRYPLTYRATFKFGSHQEIIIIIIIIVVVEAAAAATATTTTLAFLRTSARFVYTVVN